MLMNGVVIAADEAVDGNGNEDENEDEDTDAAWLSINTSMC